MFLARFGYNVAPNDREQAIDLIRSELAAARQRGIEARMLVPFTRAPGGASLIFEIEVDKLDDIEDFRHQSPGRGAESGAWAHELSKILLDPPNVEILRIAQ